MRSQFHAEGCLRKSCRVKSVLDAAMLHHSTQPLHHSIQCLSVGVADILKRRLLTLCSDDSKSRKFQLCSGLSNGRCPTGYRLSLLCLLVLVRLLRICAHAYLNHVARRIFIFGVGFALSVLISKAMREPQKVELARANSTLFCMPKLMTNY